MWNSGLQWFFALFNSGGSPSSLAEEGEILLSMPFKLIKVNWATHSPHFGFNLMHTFSGVSATEFIEQTGLGQRFVWL